MTPSEENKPTARKIWTVGTLTYTAGGLTILFAWLLWGDFAWSMKDRSIVPVFQLLLKRFDSSDFLVGLLIGSLPAAVGLILGPWISMRSDRHRGKWGRRIPYLLIPTPFAALSMFALAVGPTIGGVIHDLLGPQSPGLNFCVLAVLAFFWTTFELATTIAQAVFGALINDVVPTEVIGRFYGLFRAVSLLAGIIFNFWIMGHAEEYFFWILIGMALLYAVGFSMMCFMVKEGDYPPPEPLDPGLKNPVVAGIRTYLRECFTNPYYLWVFGALTLGMLAFGPFNAFSIFYAKSIGMSMDSYGKYIALTYTISICLTYLLGSLADRFHPLRIGIVTLGLYAAAALWAGLFAVTVETFAFGLVAHGVLSGAYMTGTASINQRLFPRARFAQFASAAGIFGAMCFMLMQPLVGGFLDLTGHVYRYTFLLGGGTALAAIVLFMVVFPRWKALGGDKNYVAP